MSLTAAFQIGRSALSASSLALQVTGNNFANAANPGYSRQLVNLAGMGDARTGSYLMGRGVRVAGINRQIDAALQARYWSGLSSEANAGVDQQVLAQLESTLNALNSEHSLSADFGRFFDAWSSLANSPGGEGSRALVVQQGRTLASNIRTLRNDLGAIRTQIDQQLGATVQQADALLGQVADLNRAILEAEGGGGGQANNLRDQRDQLVGELSTLLDVSIVEQPSGALDILVGSTPVVLGTTSRGLELRRITVGDRLEVAVQVRADETELAFASGAIAGLIGQRNAAIDSTIASLDRVASQLIFQVNRVHSSGRGSAAFTSLRGVTPVGTADQSRALNDPANLSLGGLPFRANNGGFLVTVTNDATGQSQTVRINVDLDGIDNAGQPGFGNDTSVTSLAADLDSIANLSATVNPDGTLNLNAASGYTFEFAEDTSGALAVLGINTYFTGTGASDIGVRQALVDQPNLLAHGRSVGGEFTDNGAALAMLGLRDQPIAALDGRSITSTWLETAQGVGSRAYSARTRAESTTLVRQSLDAQKAAVSGVSLDEESINLMNYQRQYQGAARFISVIDQLTQELMAIV